MPKSDRSVEKEEKKSKKSHKSSSKDKDKESSSFSSDKDKSLKKSLSFSDDLEEVKIFDAEKSPRDKKSSKEEKKKLKQEEKDRLKQEEKEKKKGEENAEKKLQEEMKKNLKDRPKSADSARNKEKEKEKKKEEEKAEKKLQEDMKKTLKDKAKKNKQKEDESSINLGSSHGDEIDHDSDDDGNGNSSSKKSKGFFSSMFGSKNNDKDDADDDEENEDDVPKKSKKSGFGLSWFASKSKQGSDEDEDGDRDQDQDDRDQEDEDDENNEHDSVSGKSAWSSVKSSMTSVTSIRFKNKGPLSNNSHNGATANPNQRRTQGDTQGQGNKGSCSWSLFGNRLSDQVTVTRVVRVREGEDGYNSNNSSSTSTIVKTMATQTDAVKVEDGNGYGMSVVPPYVPLFDLGELNLIPKRFRRAETYNDLLDKKRRVRERLEQQNAVYQTIEDERRDIDQRLLNLQNTISFDKLSFDDITLKSELRRDLAGPPLAPQSQGQSPSPGLESQGQGQGQGLSPSRNNNNNNKGSGGMGLQPLPTLPGGGRSQDHTIMYHTSPRTKALKQEGVLVAALSANQTHPLARNQSQLVHNTYRGGGQFTISNTRYASPRSLGSATGNQSDGNNGNNGNNSDRVRAVSPVRTNMTNMDTMTLGADTDCLSLSSPGSSSSSYGSPGYPHPQSRGGLHQQQSQSQSQVSQSPSNNTKPVTTPTQFPSRSRENNGNQNKNQNKNQNQNQNALLLMSKKHSVLAGREAAVLDGTPCLSFAVEHQGMPMALLLSEQQVVVAHLELVKSQGGVFAKDTCTRVLLEDVIGADINHNPISQDEERKDAITNQNQNQGVFFRLRIWQDQQNGGGEQVEGSVVFRANGVEDANSFLHALRQRQQ